MNLSLNEHLAPSSSITSNLIAYALNFDSFASADYVVFTDTDYSYYIVWGNLEKTDNFVIGTDVEYCHYYRTSSSGYTNTYTYVYGTDNSFALDLSSGYVPTSNLEEVGFASTLVSELRTNVVTLGLLILAVSMLFAIMIKVFRGLKT